MVDITLPEPAKGFYYSDEPQRSPWWIANRIGKIGASDLHRWMAVSKRDGKPRKARLDLEREIAFEKAFNTPFSMFTTAAMQEGIDNEAFVRSEYESQSGNKVQEVGCFYNDHFVASPDGLIGEDGGLEIKWLQDNSWSEVIATGKPYSGSSGDHNLQIQGNLYASGRKWWDYVAANPNTGRFIVIRVERDEDIIAGIAESVQDVKHVEPLKTEGVFEFSTSIPVNEGDDIWS